MLSQQGGPTLQEPKHRHIFGPNITSLMYCTVLKFTLLILFFPILNWSGHGLDTLVLGLCLRKSSLVLRLD